MRVTGIVSEFNPFHNGHKYLVERARAKGATHIVTVMGGDFLQRGNCAVLGKYRRAEAAVAGGVDLVLELPAVFACASAERFARGAVSTLRACGCVDEICCGSENMPPMQSMLRAAELLKSADLSEYLKKGFSYPRAVSAVFEKSGDEQAAGILRYPNDVLAFEYFREGMDDFDFLRIRRTAPHDGDISEEDRDANCAYHDFSGADEKYISASAIRKMIASGGDWRAYVPETTARIIDSAVREGLCPAGYENNERGVVSVLRRMTSGELRALPDVSEGLENRLYRAAHENDTLGSIIAAVKCKRYTHARICRIIACAYIGITAVAAQSEPEYIRVLAFGRRGTEILKQMKSTAKLPVLMTARDFARLPPSARRMLDTDLRAADLFGLCTPAVQPCGEDYYRGAVNLDA